MNKATMFDARRSFLSRASLAVALLIGGLAGSTQSAGSALPGANGKIAFASDRSGQLHIYTMNPDGSDVTALTSGSFIDMHPQWSPDGGQIAFASTRGDNVHFSIFVMNAHGGGVTRLTDNPADDERPTWSPDGKRIAFESNRVTSLDPDGHFEIYVMNADGSGQTQLTSSHTRSIAPNWSPLGDKIIFSRQTSDGWQIFLMNVDGTGLAALPNAVSELQVPHPNWSPDGQKVVFERDAGGGVNLYLINVAACINFGDCSLTKLTHDGFTEHFPAWSPDGTKIVFSRYHRFAIDNLVVMNPDGSGQTPLTDEGDSNKQPDWQPVDN